MASRILHLAVAKEIMKKTDIIDKNRFFLGCILPDAYNPQAPKTNSHLKIFVCGNSKETYDLEKFRAIYVEKMKVDMLYVGYYFHLIQDLIFRELVYEKYKWNPMLSGNVERLHCDYGIINKYIIGTYGISNDINVPENIRNEEIYKIYPFEVEIFLADMDEDFASKPEGDIFFFTKEMADEFISTATEICVEEYKAIVQDSYFVDAYTYAWINKPFSLLKTTQNTRDLCGYRKKDGNLTREFSLIRSDVQNRPDKEDIDTLKLHGITTIIDMRGEKDIIRKPSGFADVQGFRYYNFQIDEGSGVPENYEAVPASYMKIAEAKAMPDVFRCIANAPDGVMFNCTAGKDRTGVVAAILLCHVGVSDNDIIENYVLTKEYGKERLELVHKNFPELDMRIVTPCEYFMEEFLRLFRDKYGDTDGYFKAIGLTDEEAHKIRDKF